MGGRSRFAPRVEAKAAGEGAQRAAGAAHLHFANDAKLGPGAKAVIEVNASW